MSLSGEQIGERHLGKGNCIVPRLRSVKDEAQWSILLKTLKQEKMGAGGHRPIPEGAQHWVRAPLGV